MLEIGHLTKFSSKQTVHEDREKGYETPLKWNWRRKEAG